MAHGSYAYAVGNVRARETGLLTRAELEQLLALDGPAQLAAALRDRGYGDPAAQGNVEELLRQETAKLWAYLRDVAPDFSLFDAFLIRNDYHNLKAAVKGVMSGRDVADLLLSPYTVDPAELTAAAEERRFDRLPPSMAAAGAKAYDILARATDAQLADAVIDRAAMEAMLAAAEKTKVPMMVEVVAVIVFYNNIKTALRAARVGKSRDFLDTALCPCPGFPLEEVKRAALAGEEELLQRMDGLDAYGCREAAERYRRSPSAFEKWADDRAMEKARRGKAVTLGPEPLIGYYLAKEAEIRTLHILHSGLRTGREEADIRERLRELYG